MRKKTISLILILAMMATLFSGCHRPVEETLTTKLSLDEQARIAANNMQNDSCFATDGEYLYCSSWDEGDEKSIIKVCMDDFSIESTYETAMSYGEAFCPDDLVWVNDMLYYYNDRFDVLFSLDTEMTQSMAFPFSAFFHAFQTDGEYYYVSDHTFFGETGIFRVAISDISEDTKNDKSIFTKISDLYASQLFMQGEYLYVYTSKFTLNGATLSEPGWWRVDLDGSNPIKISENKPRHLIVAEDRIYVVEEEDCIYSMNLDGSNRNVLTEAYIDADLSVTSINTAGGYVFYRYAEDGTLHRVNADGTNDIQLNECETTSIVIAGDWVIYQNEEDWKYYKMHFDGSCHSLISEVPTEEVPSASEPTEATKTSEMPTETEPAIQMQGWYTLEDCTNSSGFFIAHEDGSFSRYRHGGYCLGLTSGEIAFEGMFLADSIADSLPVISTEDTLALFWGSNYSAYVFPIHGEIATIQVTAEDGTEGFGRIESSSSMNIHYRNHESARVRIQTINGESPDKYQIEKVIITVNPYSGMRRESVSWQLTGFKRDATVSLGIAEGTLLVETTYDIDSKYYACNPEMNNWDEEDVYYPGTLATKQGYAALDFTEIPSGCYILVVRGNGKYIATLLNWKNS